MDQIKKRQGMEDAIDRLGEAIDLLIGIDALDGVRTTMSQCSGQIEEAIYALDREGLLQSHALDFDMVEYAGKLMRY